jgi:DNA-binding HxlR family transcriptional regulator
MTNQECRKAHLAVQDTLSVVGGKWKLVILAILMDETKRFKELSRESGISPRILSKELKELEMNNLVSRTVCDTRPITVEYAATPYSQTLRPVTEALHNWGVQHREEIIGSERSLESVH